MALRDVIGQDRVIRILLKTLERGRFPSSYLFAGESGIGKKLTAINLAKVLNNTTAVILVLPAGRSIHTCTRTSGCCHQKTARSG
jgi:DNA polymerase III gamma/tau subunit